MAERRKGKKKKELDAKDLEKKPTKEEYAIARYLKQKLPEKKTTLLGHKVEYFIASKAVDCLLESPWAKDTKKGEIHFNNRDAAVYYMERMLEQKLFHRAKKIIVQKESKKKKKDEEGAESGKDTKKSKGKSDTEKKDEKGTKKDEKETKKDEKETKKDEKETKKESEVDERKKEKKKIKLDMHLEQIFVDSNEPYVWIYDPIPIRTWITGTLMVIAAVLICLFPLWPQTIRHYIYYLSVAAAFFLVFIIALAVFRLIFFVIVWLVTFGKHHIWLLPNLTEDVGFFESFWPLYKYEYRGTVAESDKDKKKEKTANQSDKEESQDKEFDGDKSDGSSSDQEKKEIDQNQSGSEESGDEKQKNDNGFEIIEADDANESQSEEDRKTK